MIGPGQDARSMSAAGRLIPGPDARTAVTG